jgi:molybdate transport system substrate-binding protein
MRRLILLLATIIAFAVPAAAEPQRIVVFAAASMKTALDAAAAAYKAGGGSEVAVSYGGSLGLARQIIAGAPADIFVSADEPSMDEAEKANVIRPGSRFDWLANRLVVVAPKNSPLATLAFEPQAFTQALGDGKLATGEVATVPVGRYAKASLTKLGLWDVVQPHLAMSDNVRAALAFVARGEATLGIVYATDAAAEPGVKIVATFPDDSHPPIRYPAAFVKSSDNAEAAKFLDFLKSPGGRVLFEAQGFTIVP